MPIKFKTVAIGEARSIGRSPRSAHPFWEQVAEAAINAYEADNAIYVPNGRVPGSLKSVDASIRRAVLRETNGYFRASIRRDRDGRYVWLVPLFDEDGEA